MGRVPPRASRLRLTPHASRLTPHASRLTPHASRLTPHPPNVICPCAAVRAPRGLVHVARAGGMGGDHSDLPGVEPFVKSASAVWYEHGCRRARNTRSAARCRPRTDGDRLLISTPGERNEKRAICSTDHPGSMRRHSCTRGVRPDPLGCTDPGGAPCRQSPGAAGDRAGRAQAGCRSGRERGHQVSPVERARGDCAQRPHQRLPACTRPCAPA